MTTIGPDPGAEAPAAEAPASVPGLEAAIDIGTNSIHVVVARTGPGGYFEVVTRDKETVRLGQGGGELDHLDADAIERALAALRRFRTLADNLGARVTAVATSAVREASNRDQLIERARREAGVHIEVISGVEEARLIHLGVLQAVPVHDRPHLAVDIGGGSTEIVVAKGLDLRLARSVKLGAIRLTDRFFPGGAIQPGQLDACRAYVRSYLSPLAHEIRQTSFEVAVGTSGTVIALAGVVERARGGSGGGTMTNVEITRAGLEGALALVFGAATVPERRAIAGLDERRAEIIVGGAVLLEQIFEELGLDRLVVSEYALREGVLLDRAAVRHGDELHHLSDIRRDAVARLVELYERDAPHAARCTDLALGLFDATAEVHGLAEPERDLLEAGGMLHNIGLSISHSAHHKHSHYIIRNSDQLVGFTDREIELMALVARYHRKSPPSERHADYRSLSPRDRRVVSTLAGLLRVGIALDRSHAGVVAELTCRRGEGELALHPVIRPGADASLERYAVEQRKSLLEETLGLRVRLADPDG